MTPLEERQILHPFICKQFGFETMPEMLMHFTSNRVAGWEIKDGMSSYARALENRLSNSQCPVTPDDLAKYDENIITHSKRLNMDTAQRSWKPFQYLALLFTEHYLHRYFDDKDSLCEDLNAARILNSKMQKDDISYTAGDLQTLAFQSATGSGKTLILHANIRQYMHYLEKAGQRRDFNKIILVTPDENMSLQHLTELEKSGFEARLFSSGRQSTLGSGDDVIDIIDLHKLSDKSGLKRVAVESFEDNNLVLVDEGHLGTSGKVWRERRKILASNGFSFEYSATFNQAVANKDTNDLRDSYAKCLLFDYSYKHFYGDGYGKDYNIKNLQNDSEQSTNKTYLLACLMQFYQQCRIFRDKGHDWRDYNITPPLLVFLGNRVTAINSDVIAVVQFLAWVMQEKNQVMREITSLINDRALLHDAKNNPIFAGAFDYIKTKLPQSTSIYDDMAECIFNGIGQMHLTHCTQGDEIHLRVGDKPVFGVINVGETSKLYKLFDEDENKLYTTEKDPITKALFSDVDNEHSQVTTVIGAQKFAAGWSSWRVSTMGLLHVGTGEGSQIIQMFGRGVRLKGKDMHLKRHTTLEDENPQGSNELALLETLNIFGLRANYMEQFKKYLNKEGIATEWESVYLPVVKNFAEPTGLKTLKLPPDAKYEKSAERVHLFTSALPSVVTLNMFQKLQMLESNDGTNTGTAKNEIPCQRFTVNHITLFNRREIYHAVLKYKHEKDLHNIEITQSDIDSLLNKNDWYELNISAEKLDFKDKDYGQVLEWQKIMIDLIKLHISAVWKHCRRSWESVEMKLVNLNHSDGNFFDQYEIRINSKEKALITQIRELAEKLKDVEDYDNEIALGSLLKNFHGYQPLLYSKNKDIEYKVSPVVLNKGEVDFVESIKRIIDNPLDELDGVDIYLLRNLGRGRGISLFNDYGFYSDFILWLQKDDKQHIIFVDPKGLVHGGIKTNKKISMNIEIKKLEGELQKYDQKIALHSYIWSVTPMKDISFLDGNLDEEELATHGIYLSSAGDDGIIKMLNDALAV